ncbi:MAG: hypothetical protein B7Z16_07970 [Algoriphagus sp. 32-45-6]|nr:MAG: hypothetical protein B7Z16_07970 [Algoriphagus sp. 32-45-6]
METKSECQRNGTEGKWDCKSREIQGPNCYRTAVGIEPAGEVASKLECKSQIDLRKVFLLERHSNG